MQRSTFLLFRFIILVIFKLRVYSSIYFHDKEGLDRLLKNSELEKLSRALFQQATATCHKNKITVYFESDSSLYTHGNEASIHPSTEAT